MTRPALRLTLAVLAVSAAVPGLQATIAPESFFDGFPLGRAWVGTLPPYNEHLVHDVGNYKTAFALLFAWAAWQPARALVVPVSAAWTVAATLHLAYHVHHLDGLGGGDAVALTTTLVAAVVLPVLAIVMVRRDPVPGRRAPTTPRGTRPAR